MVPLPLVGPAAHAVSAVAALEELQAVSAFPVVARAHLALRQHWLADARPEVPGAAEALGAICGPQAGVAFHAFHSMRLIAVGSWRHFGVMLRGAVVFVPAGDDGRVCSVHVHNLANTVDAAVSCATHGVPRATLADLPARQADTSGVAAELVPSAVIVSRANTCQLQGVGGPVSRASRGGGARARADSVGAFASEDPRQVLDGVGVHRDGPRVNFPEVSKEREIRKQCALH